MKRQILVSSLILLSIQTLASAAVLYVPSRDYPTIQGAINAAVNGDVVVVAPNPNPRYPVSYSGAGNVDLDFGGKAITVRSEINPDNPDPGIVAATIIDCQGTRYSPHRAFHFHSGEGPNSKVLGFTIINGYARGLAGAAGWFAADPPVPYEPIPTDDDPPPPRAERGSDSPDATDPNSAGYGGAILCEGASPTIQYCVISNCTVTGAQGGDGAPGQWGPWSYTPPDPNDPNLPDPNAEPEEVDDGQWGGHGGDGSGNGYGGAIACVADINSISSNPIISDCTISDNFARGGCGGNGGDGGYAKEYPDYDQGDESFGGDAGNSNGDGMGGGIYAENGSSPAITNCTFSNNIAATGTRAAGGLAGRGKTIGKDQGGPATDGASGLVFSTGGIAGGAAYYNTGSDPNFNNPNFTNCTFTGNKAYEAYVFYDPYFGEDISAYTVGGALYSDANNTVTLDNCKFIGNLGGAVYCDFGCNLNFDDCSFTDNSEIANGGAVYISPGCTVDIQNSIFSGNSAYDDGGALKCGSDATLTNCSFGNNVADSDNDGYGYGGAIDAYLPGTTLIIDVNNCSFTGNQSIYGGGFSSENFDATFTNCYFIGNTAQEGGGLDLVNGDVFVTGGIVRGNNATDGDGGGFDCSYTITQIRDCTISDNSADGVYPTGSSGGAINFYGGAPTQAVFNCLITGNSATIDGGAIFCRNAAPEIGNCTFSGNLAGGYGGAIFSDFISDPNITDCIFESCSNHAIHEEDFGGNAIVTYSLFYGNPGGDYYDSGTGLTYRGPGEIGSIPGGSNNLYGDPLFVTGPLGKFYLRQQPVQPLPQSPAVDTGSADANDPNIGLDTYTTRTDSVGDAHQVDRGYHYIDVADVDTFQLTASVIGGHGTVEATAPEPLSYVSGIYTYYQGTAVILTATPDNPAHRIEWTGTNDDLSTSLTNTVTMSEDKEVFVRFYEPRTLNVPGDYTNLQHAIDDANDGDIVLIAPSDEPYYTVWGFDISGKAITITSANPDDPCCVASTIIEMQQPGPGGLVGPAFYISSVNPDTVLNGLTIRGFNLRGLDGDNGDPDDDYWDGLPGVSAYGGAIDCWYASPTIKNCVITDCSVRGGNGGNGAGGNDDHPDGGHGGWPGQARGGGMGCLYNSSPVVINCTFDNCRAYGGNGGDGGNGNGDPWGYGGRGGGWYYSYPPFTPYEWGPFDFYTAYSGHGGAVYADTSSSPTFIDCTFTDNRTEGGTCGICGQNGPPNRRAEPTIHWKIDNFGGAVYLGGRPYYYYYYYPYDYNEPMMNESKFMNCTFSNNIADTNTTPDSEDEFVSYGGAVAFEVNSVPSFDNCTFNDNLASIGGAMYWEWAEPLIGDCNFVANTGLHGGGVYFVGGSSKIYRSNFRENHATGVIAEGGGIYCFDANTLIVDCNITDNDAGGSGGGIYFGGSEKLLVKNCLITENSADRDGGGISANWNSESNIINCTIVGNTVTGVGFDTGYGGGVCCSYENYAIITNSIIWGNYAINGGDLAITTGFEQDPRPAYVKVAYSDIKGGAPEIFVDIGCTLEWDIDPGDPNYPTNIDADPLFVDDYHLSQTEAGDVINSPCVDVGSDSAVALGLYGYTTRTDSVPDMYIVDMGYHYRMPIIMVSCDFDFDGDVDLADLGILLSYWLEDRCDLLGWCEGADLDSDRDVDFRDYAIYARAYAPPVDLTPPTPNPSKWETPPYEYYDPDDGKYYNRMVAVTASDPSGVEYDFDCWEDAYDSGWQDSPIYNVHVTVPLKQYSYRVKTRDKSPHQNETDYSAWRYPPL